MATDLVYDALTALYEGRPAREPTLAEQRAALEAKADALRDELLRVHTDFNAVMAELAAVRIKEAEASLAIVSSSVH